MTRLDWDQLQWVRSTSGSSIRTSWAGLHLSVWRKPNTGAIHFTISGALPGATDGKTGREALWQRIARHLPAGRSGAV